VVTLDLGVVLLNWNRLADALACLDSIYFQQEVPRFPIVVDNGSSDGSVEGMRRWVKGNPLFRADLSGDERSDGRATWEFELGKSWAARSVPARQEPARFVLVASELNLGFSAGNNVGRGVQTAFRVG
jgi:GT2 family glycosyltransferase